MIHYHGGPITPKSVAIEVWSGRHGMVSFYHPWQIKEAAELCQSFALDNGAFSAWKVGAIIDWAEFHDFVEQWRYHPGFDWAIIPDVIDGDEAANDALLERWKLPSSISVPVWHLHESLERLKELVLAWPRIALGSSGEFADPGNNRWWNRIAEAMAAVCDERGRPKTKLHGLRMLDPTIFSHIPLASADSTNVAMNHAIDKKWSGPYQPLDQETRALVLARRIESHAAANRWNGTGGIQKNFELVG